MRRVADQDQPQRRDDRERHDPEAVRDLDYACDQRGLMWGNRVVPLVDGQHAFPAMLDAIAAATRVIHLETYILADDRIGRTFASLLIERARAGVAVRIVFDALGSLTLSRGFVADLRDAGIEVLEYRPLLARRNWGRWSRRDHRKILVCDGEVAFVGGLNIADDYAPADLGGGGWRDTHARVEGPVVAQLEDLFFSTWHGEGGRPYASTPAPHPKRAAPGLDWAAVLASGPRGTRTVIRRHYLHAIHQAQQYVYIANSYFVPDPGLRRALIRAARRGVNVHVLTSEKSDLRSVQFAGEATYRSLLRGGVHIHLWPETNMHAKTAVVDGVWSSIGSYNLDYVSLFQNLEVALEVVSRPLGSRMRQLYEVDLLRSRELDRAAWRRRPWWRKVLEWLFYRLRRWL